MFCAYSGVTTAPPTMMLGGFGSVCSWRTVSSMLGRVVVISADRPTRRMFSFTTASTTVSGGTSRPKSSTS